MRILQRKVPNHYIPIHRDNVSKNDWIILVEAGTIVGPSAEDQKLRVAQATLERKIVRKYNLLLRAEHYLVMEGYDPRIHALYFCPQLYQFDTDNRLVPLQGEEIGKLVVQAVQGGVVEKRAVVRALAEVAGRADHQRRHAARVRHRRRRWAEQVEIGGESATVASDARPLSA
jgi:hypothetical protein